VPLNGTKLAAIIVSAFATVFIAAEIAAVIDPRHHTVPPELGTAGTAVILAAVAYLFNQQRKDGNGAK
jgi:hypothetical protein